MVYRRNREKAPDENSTSDISSDSAEEDLDNLIDDLLEKLAVCPSRPQRMTIKNRKDRSKHERADRSSAIDVAGSSKDDSRSFGFQRYQYSPEERGQGLVRSRGRQARPHIPPTGVRPGQFSYSTYVSPENVHTQPLKRRWPRSLEPSKKTCDKLSECLDGAPEAGAGNNSEDEYYSITDNTTQNASKSEDNGLEQLLKEKKGLKVVRVHGDGACLFRSVSHQVYGDEEKHEIVRKQVVDYMYKNREHFSQYVTEDFDRYLHRKRQPTCYGNHLEIQAISELYNRPVEIYYNNVVPINVFHAEYSHDVPIRLRYCGRTHYNSIIDPCKPSFGQGLGMPNYQPGLPEKDLVKQAILESEASELEEAMLRDKLAESETKQLEDCIAEHVLRESLYEHVKARLDSPTVDRQRSTPQPAPSNPSASNTSATTNAPVSQPGLSVAASGSLQQAACSSSALSKPSSSATAAAADPGLGDFAVLQHIPPSMLDMSEEDVLAMVLEQSRSDYINSLRAAASSTSPSSLYREEREEEGDLSPGPVNDAQSQPTAQSYFRRQLDANETTSLGEQFKREEGGGC